MSSQVELDERFKVPPPFEWCKYPERKPLVPELLKRIRPIVKSYKTHKLHFADPRDPFGTAFTWDPDKVGIMGTKYHPNYLPFFSLYTYHTWAYYGFFKPTVWEVLAQIPEEFLAQTKAFHIARIPDNTTDKDFWPLVNRGVHKAGTTLYK